MGRKNRDKVSKYKTETTKEVEENDIENEEEKELDRINKINENNINSIWETRKKMVKYCDYMCLPLCDYLTNNILEDFIYHISS
jgi:hypothetical protein